VHVMRYLEEIPAKSHVDGQLAGRLPFVLEVGAPAVLTRRGPGEAFRGRAGAGVAHQPPSQRITAGTTGQAAEGDVGRSPVETVAQEFQAGLEAVGASGKRQVIGELVNAVQIDARAAVAADNSQRWNTGLELAELPVVIDGYAKLAHAQ